MGESNTEDGDTTNRQQSKIVRLVEEYDLDGLGEELEQRWTGDASEQYSLRDLAAYFNKQILRRAMETANMRPLEGEIDNTYRLLTGDEVSGGERTETYRRLEQNGIDIDELEAKFVSHQTIYRYLREHRDVHRGEETYDEDEAIEKGEETIQRLRSRTEVITESTIERLAKSGYVDVDEFDILVNVSLTCENCGRSYDITEFLSRQACDCTASSK